MTDLTTTEIMILNLLMSAKGDVECEVRMYEEEGGRPEVLCAAKSAIAAMDACINVLSEQKFISIRGVAVKRGDTVTIGFTRDGLSVAKPEGGVEFDGWSELQLALRKLGFCKGVRG